MRRGPRMLAGAESISVRSLRRIALPTSLRRTPRSRGFETKSNAPSLRARTGAPNLPRAAVLDPGDQVETASIRKPHVGQAQIELLVLQQPARCGDIGRGPRVEIHA